jgi:hypothetical protein
MIVKDSRLLPPRLLLPVKTKVGRHSPSQIGFTIGIEDEVLERGDLTQKINWVSQESLRQPR